MLMSFAREVSDRIIFFDNGTILEEGNPKEFFLKPKEERTKQVLKGIIKHLFMKYKGGLSYV